MEKDPRRGGSMCKGPVVKGTRELREKQCAGRELGEN